MWCQLRVLGQVRVPALRGRGKVENLKRNNRVCFEAETGVGIVQAESACDSGVRYMSVIGTGIASFIIGIPEKRKILDLFMEKYAGPGAWAYMEAVLL
jgi:uncharacterized protein